MTYTQFINSREDETKMNNTLLPGYDRPVSEAHIIDKELLQAAQQLARKHEDWAFANAALRKAYGK
jgi:hypothetical protein